MVGEEGSRENRFPPHPDVAAVSPTSNVHVGMHVSSHWFLDWMNCYLGYMLLDGSSRVVELCRMPALAGILRRLQEGQQITKKGERVQMDHGNILMGLMMMVQYVRV
jgi:hypothetical protein